MINTEIFSSDKILGIITIMGILELGDKINCLYVIPAHLLHFVSIVINLNKKPMTWKGRLKIIKKKIQSSTLS